jgi:hypothetical protein
MILSVFHLALDSLYLGHLVFEMLGKQSFRFFFVLPISIKNRLSALCAFQGCLVFSVNRSYASYIATGATSHGL